MNIDPIKITDKLAELNAGHDNPIWIASEDYGAIVKLTFNDNGDAQFHSSTGLPLKTFINISTGEVKIFHLTAFTVDGEA